MMSYLDQFVDETEFSWIKVIPCSTHLRLEPPSWATREHNGNAALESVIASSSECSPPALKQGLHEV